MIRALCKGPLLLVEADLNELDRGERAVCTVRACCSRSSSPRAESGPRGLEELAVRAQGAPGSHSP